MDTKKNLEYIAVFFDELEKTEFSGRNLQASGAHPVFVKETHGSFAEYVLATKESWYMFDSDKDRDTISVDFVAKQPKMTIGYLNFCEELDKVETVLRTIYPE